jgi:hypothetical protein
VRAVVIGIERRRWNWKRAYNYQVLICLKINDETFFDDEIFIDNFFSNFDTSIMPIIFYIYFIVVSI